MQLTIGDMHEGGYVATQIQQRMEFHGRLGGFKQRPGKN